MNKLFVLLITAAIQYFTIFRMTGGIKGMFSIVVNLVGFVVIYKFLGKYLESM